MIIGINFTNDRRDVGLLEDWRRVLRLKKFYGGQFKVYLQGIADSRREIDHAIAMADNGRREFMVVPRFKRSKTFYGLYIG